ncbi:hypothetical protein [Butyrivibrio sp. AD3002]|uniref:hypothetical protein n=1 Tax=Butyrivibrio sp. AD3002 TaxID=1280670 RepID=UPI0003B33FBA|nr:hypothetical protein [Butyrivibrio sp. AD3002]
MGKFSRMGAAALVAALSFSMVAPISANAEIMKNYDAATDTYTYCNEDTNEVVTFKADEGKMEDTSLLYNEKKVYYVNVGQYMEIPSIYTTPDVVKFTGFKSSSKNLKLRMYDSFEATNTGSPKYAYYKKVDGKKLYFYRDVNGNMQSAEWDALKEMYKGSGWYRLQFYAKKPGKYKVNFNAVNAQGAVVANKSITIIAKADTRAIKSITFAGKNVLKDTDGDGRDDYRNYYAKTGNYTTKKKGKLVVTANKGYKIKKLEISSAVVAADKPDDGWEGTKNKGTEEVDLNGNGRTDDVVNGQSEKSVNRVWKTIKNKKTLKLSTTSEDAEVDYSLVNKKDNSKTKVRKTNGIIHPTFLRVTYYDTKNKRTVREVYEIWLLKK